MTSPLPHATLAPMLPAGRLAPTPSGFLHAGNVANFLLNWLMVRQLGGKLWLRIDDMDATRLRTEYLDNVFDTLDWLGFDYDEGPSGTGNFLDQWSQQHRMPLYRQWLQRLQHQQAVYACTCSRKQVLARTGHSRYDGHCRTFPQQEQAAFALRLSLPEEPCTLYLLDGSMRVISPHRTMGDPIIWRRDGLPAYQLASVADDDHMGITLVARGEDLLGSTACQQLLYRQATGIPHVVSMVHHPLIKDADGGKLSKRTAKAPRTLQQLYTRQQVLKLAATCLGLPQKKSAERAADFLEDIPTWHIPKWMGK